MVKYYTAEKVTDAVTCIRSMTGELLYLIEGAAEALLVDSCLGVGRLRRFVEGLTEKPVTVVLTHGHLDHALGAPEFDRVFMNHADKELYEQMSPLEQRIGYIRGGLNGKLPDFDEADYVPPSPMDFQDLKDGDSFDLGGIHADIYGLPGHTKGSMVVLVREERILILGDACNKSTFLFDENTLPVRAYREELIRIAGRLEGQYDRVFISHHQMEVHKEILQNVIQVCDAVLAGETDDVPFEFMGQQAYIAFSADEHMNRADGVDGNLIYSKERLG